MELEAEPPFCRAGQGSVGGGPPVKEWQDGASPERAANRKGCREERHHTVDWHQALTGDIGKVGQFQPWLGRWMVSQDWELEARMPRQRNTRARTRMWELHQCHMPHISTQSLKLSTGTSYYGGVDVTSLWHQWSICKSTVATKQWDTDVTEESNFQFG